MEPSSKTLWFPPCRLHIANQAEGRSFAGLPTLFSFSLWGNNISGITKTIRGSINMTDDYRTWQEFVPEAAIAGDKNIRLLVDRITLDLKCLSILVKEWETNNPMVEQGMHSPEEITPANPFPEDPNFRVG
jgi:hypothetical protein